MAARKRREGESFKAYREALKYEAKVEKRSLRGRVLWAGYNGTYIRAKHGRL